MTGKAIREALEPCPFVRVPRSKLQEARDLLTEKIRGSNARSPNHNARLVIDELLDSTACDAIGLKAEHIEAFRTVLESVLSAETSGARSPAIDFEARRFIRDHGAAILASLSPDDASAADAEIGRDFLNAIEAARDEYPWLANWTPAERYGELIGDLLDIAFPGGSASSDIVRDVVRKAILFSDWAAGEGICSSNPHIADPADFMSRLYVRGDETPDAIADAAVSCLSTHTAAGAGPVDVGSPEWCDRAERSEWAFMAKMLREAIDYIAPVNLSGLGVAEGIAKSRSEEGWRTKAAGAGPVGEAVAWQRRLSGPKVKDEGWHMVTQGVAAFALEHGHPEGLPDVTCEVRPLYAHPVEEPGEVERLTYDRDFWVVSFQVEVKARIAAEAALAESEQNAQGLASDLAGTQADLAETRERLEKEEAALHQIAWPAGWFSPSPRSIARAALTGDAQEVGR